MKIDFNWELEDRLDLMDQLSQLRRFGVDLTRGTEEEADERVENFITTFGEKFNLAGTIDSDTGIVTNLRLVTGELK